MIYINKIVEKPGSENKAPSNIASVGGYIFEPKLFSYLKNALGKLKQGEEFIFQPSIQRMIEDGGKVYGCVIDGKYYDTGDKLEYLKTVVDFALMHNDLNNEFMKFLEQRIKT